MQPRIIEDLPEDDYHSQKGATVPRLTYSIAKELIKRSPLHAWWIHPLLGGKNKKQSKAMDIGKILHSLLLGGDQKIELIPFDEYRTNEAKFLRDSAIANGRIPLKPTEYENVFSLKNLVEPRLREEAPEFFEDHKSELTVIWTDENEVEWQSRFDWIQIETGKMIDLKFTTNASPDKCERKILDMGYYLQEQAYTKAFNLINPAMAGRTEWQFIFVENEGPYAVTPVETDAVFESLGMEQIEKASRTWKECLSTGKWPGYGKHVATCPPWALRNSMQEE